MSGEPNQKVSLEDLLRLKREERPTSEYWSQFDRELRAKQLAALSGAKAGKALFYFNFARGS